MGAVPTCSQGLKGLREAAVKGVRPLRKLLIGLTPVHHSLAERITEGRHGGSPCGLTGLWGKNL